jgi:hypothetical protein
MLARMFAELASQDSTQGKRKDAENNIFRGGDWRQVLHLRKQRWCRISRANASQSFPLEVALGFISEIHFKTKESGRSLDDLHLLLENRNGSSRWLVSTKSNRRLLGKGFNGTLVADLGADWNGQGGASFDPNPDMLGLVRVSVGERCENVATPLCSAIYSNS